jgi:hypothetical protein
MASGNGQGLAEIGACRRSAVILSMLNQHRVLANGWLRLREGATIKVGHERVRCFCTQHGCCHLLISAISLLLRSYAVLAS